MVTKELLDFIVNSVKAEHNRNEEKRLERESVDCSVPRYVGSFFAVVKASVLIEPSRKKAAHHREREKHYTRQLELSEKKLRKSGLTVEVYDPSTGTSTTTPALMLSSGGINVGGMPYSPKDAPKFKAVMNQDMVNAVERNKNKMLEHREKAEKYEKHARAFAFNPEFTVRLTADDVHYFGLEGA